MLSQCGTFNNDQEFLSVLKRLRLQNASAIDPFGPWISRTWGIGFGNSGSKPGESCEAWVPLVLDKLQVSLCNAMDIVRPWPWVHTGLWHGCPGPEIGFAPAMLAALDRINMYNRSNSSTLPSLGIIKLVAGGTSMSEWAPGGRFWTLVERALQNARSRKFTASRDTKPQSRGCVRFVGMVWQNGETDALSQSQSAEWLSHFTKFVLAVRNVTVAPELPVVLGRVWKPDPAAPERWFGDVSMPLRRAAHDSQHCLC